MNTKLAGMLETRDSLMANVKTLERDGTPLEKGVVLTVDYLQKIERELMEKFEYYTAYPDLFLDEIKPEDENFSLFFYQRITLRALMRYKEIFVTAPRAFSKSFLTILALFLQCVFMPNTKRFICAPNKNQSAQIAKEKIAEIYRIWPMLKREVIGGDVTDMPGNFGKDYVTLKLRNGSQFDVVGALDSTRGGRRHGQILKNNFDHHYFILIGKYSYLYIEDNTEVLI